MPSLNCPGRGPMSRRRGHLLLVDVHFYVVVFLEWIGGFVRWEGGEVYLFPSS